MWRFKLWLRCLKRLLLLLLQHNNTDGHVGIYMSRRGAASGYACEFVRVYVYMFIGVAVTTNNGHPNLGSTSVANTYNSEASAQSKPRAKHTHLGHINTARARPPAYAVIAACSPPKQQQNVHLAGERLQDMLTVNVALGGATSRPTRVQNPAVLVNSALLAAACSILHITRRLRRLRWLHAGVARH